jgi:hypothetical protein
MCHLGMFLTYEVSKRFLLLDYQILILHITDTSVAGARFPSPHPLPTLIVVTSHSAQMAFTLETKDHNNYHHKILLHVFT